jgi:hypothetical protein
MQKAVAGAGGRRWRVAPRPGGRAGAASGACNTPMRTPSREQLAVAASCSVLPDSRCPPCQQAMPPRWLEPAPLPAAACRRRRQRQQWQQLLTTTPDAGPERAMGG